VRRTLATLRELLEMIKFQHSLFALPFALSAMLVAAGGLPSARVVALIVLCALAARTAAMTWNRIVDARIDALNPRTADRALPAGRLRPGLAWGLLVVSAIAFVIAAAAINRATLLLAPIALVVLLSYSLGKRFTALTHFHLGLALALAPIGAWVAVTGRLDPVVLLLGLAVMAWVAGFDLLYSCQDADFDRRAGLHSLPARFGVARALLVARISHGVALIALLAFGVASQLGVAYFVALCIAAGLLVAAHAAVSARDLSRVGFAFFQVNVGVSMVMLFGTALAVFLRT
jgi:4-hydroxybenzoate polyprenyltransferase